LNCADGAYFILGHQETQTELVMFILLRLAEDVVTFQTLPTQRRRDIQQTLTQNMEKIFSFLLITLQQNVNKYRRVVRASFAWVQSVLEALGNWDTTCKLLGKQVQRLSEICGCCCGAGICCGLGSQC